MREGLNRYPYPEGTVFDDGRDPIAAAAIEARQREIDLYIEELKAQATNTSSQEGEQLWEK